jgi:hypothetical protein
MWKRCFHLSVWGKSKNPSFVSICVDFEGLGLIFKFYLGIVYFMCSKQIPNIGIHFGKKSR